MSPLSYPARLTEIEAQFFYFYFMKCTILVHIYNVGLQTESRMQLRKGVHSKAHSRLGMSHINSAHVYPTQIKFTICIPLSIITTVSRDGMGAFSK